MVAESFQPQAYRQGFVEFYKLKFMVTPDVLIPRPESELLVDEVLNFINQNRETHQTTDKTSYRKSNKILTILDVGTGSGNLAVCLAKNASIVQVVAVDISLSALQIAKQNAKLHKVSHRIIFLNSDLLSCYKTLSSYSQKPLPSPNIIVANLPYIPSRRLPYLDPSVKNFEPKIALDGGQDGFDLYRRLFQQIRQLNWQPQLMIYEIDYTQGDLAYKEAKKYFSQATAEIKTDLAQKQRILVIKNY